MTAAYMGPAFAALLVMVSLFYLFRMLQETNRAVAASVSGFEK